MIVTVKLTDGSAQTLDVTEIRASLGTSPIELSFEAAPARLRICSPETDDRWHSLTLHPRAANIVDIEAHAHDGDRGGK